MHAPKNDLTGEGLRAAIASLRAAARQLRRALGRGENTPAAARAAMTAIDELQQLLPAPEEME